jgi:hypothetical protein
MNYYGRRRCSGGAWVYTWFIQDARAARLLVREGGKVSLNSLTSREVDLSTERWWGAGWALGKAERDYFEARFQRDLSQVRIHTHTRGAVVARALGARAFTLGHHIVFAAGEYQPDTSAGRYLLAHELAHCLQQRGGVDGNRTARGVGPAHDWFELEADAVADQVLRNGPPPRLTRDGSGLARRVISVVPRSAKMTVTTRPTVQTPTVNAASGIANWRSTPIRATGEVSITGGAGDLPVGWTLGFIQAQWIETNWMYYRGQSNSGGSLFLQRARAPARPNQACRDSVGPVTDIWYNTAQNHVIRARAAFPIKLTARFFDRPSETSNLQENNTLTSQPNYLREGQLEFHFCTVLALREPGASGAFHQLLHLYWNLHWQARFQPSNFANLAAPWTITKITAGTAANVGRVISGRTNDRRFDRLITGAATQNCNQTFRAAIAAVAKSTSPNRRQARTWANFDVRR